MEADIAGLNHFEMALYQGVKLRQLMERHARIGMVLGVEGHVPGEFADQPIGERGPGVLQHVCDQRTATVLSQ